MSGGGTGLMSGGGLSMGSGGRGNGEGDGCSIMLANVATTGPAAWSVGLWSKSAQTLLCGIQFEQPRTIVRCQWRKHACFGPKDQRLTRAAHERCRVAVMHEPERVSKFVCDDVARGAGRAQRSHAIGLDNDEEALGKGSRH